MCDLTGNYTKSDRSQHGVVIVEGSTHFCGPAVVLTALGDQADWFHRALLTPVAFSQSSLRCGVHTEPCCKPDLPLGKSGYKYICFCALEGALLLLVL